MTQPAASVPSRVGFLGPLGTFTEMALLTQPDLASAELHAIGSISDVLFATRDGEVDLGFVAIENSIEGSVNVTIDTLAFDLDLRIQREVVINVQLNLLARRGVPIERIERVVSIPVAAAQCRTFLHDHLPGVEMVAANSTAEAAQMVADGDDGRIASISTALAAEMYGLEVLAEDVEDHPENQTRFVAVTPHGVPTPTGHDKTSIVVFQRTDRPGSLLGILQEFAARAINLTKLESRPTKTGLGDYCFLIDLEGHIADEVVGDCLRDLRAKCEDIKFLGSYPAAGEHGPGLRREAESNWRQADDWLQSLRSELD
ncbi:MAG TPA: prephenate dehydratase [Acidimicrobiales bacterium]|nr:prephenate dehydratase [Acidimicrobiales bacterium]